MKRSARPFTVEIKSSRRSSQGAAPAITGMPRTAPPPQQLWSGDRQDQDSFREQSPASLAALEEANRLFAKLKAGPVPAQSPDPRPSERVLVQAEQPAFDEPKADPPGRAQDTGRRGSILPDLSRTAPASGAPPQVTEQRTVSRKSRRAQRKRITPPQPSVEFGEQIASDPVVTPPSEPVVDETGPSAQAEVVAVQPPTAPAATPNERSATPRRFGRALDQSWVYRAACRRAQRRGEPPPGRAAPRRKRT
jgi:hypothetical protein